MKEKKCSINKRKQAASVTLAQQQPASPPPSSDSTTVSARWCHTPSNPQFLALTCELHRTTMINCKNCACLHN